jgi:2-(1,2-epoxy-1,2-dihydrophenyl)acetyl-CoA isomerase
MTDDPRGEGPGLVSTQRAGPCLRITLDQPERRNALTPDLLDALLEAVERIPGDDEIRVVVLTGSHGVFSVGGDLSLRASGQGLITGDPAESLARIRRATRIVELLATLPQITVAAINGACAGAGLSLAAACDLRIATARARFNTAFLTAGVSGDFAGIWSLTRVLGPARTRELYLLPGPFDAQRALDVGLVSTVVPDPKFEGGVDELVDSLLGAAPLALRAMKRNLLDAERKPLGEYLDAEGRRYLETGTTQDSIEAANAYLQKRPPVFHGV